MEQPIDRMMRQVQWTPLPMPSGEMDLPYATHQGILDIGGFKFHVYQLNTGERVIDAEDIHAFFDGLADVRPFTLRDAGHAD